MNTAFAHVWQGLAYGQSYLLAELVGRVFLIKSTGTRLLDRLFDANEPWFDGGSDQMVALEEILLAEKACRVTLELEGSIDLNWLSLDSEGFQPAFRRLGSQYLYHQRQTLKRLLQRGGGKGFR